MMVSSIVRGRQSSLSISGPPEFAPADHERLVQQPALFQIPDQGGAGLICLKGLLSQFLRQVAVVIPILVE